MPLEPSKHQGRSIITIGSVNTELIVVVDDLSRGTKGECRRIAESVGGSALNWALRLCQHKPGSNDRVYTFCPVGDDEPGKKIKELLDKKNVQLLPRLPMGNGLTTSHSVIIVGEGERTVRTKPGTAAESWSQRLTDYVTGSCKSNEFQSEASLIVMIGNIPKVFHDGDAAMVTEQTIEAMQVKKPSFIYFNPGRAQYSLCYHHWHRTFPKIHCLQLNSDEAREFMQRSLKCSECGKHKDFGSITGSTLYDILRFFISINVTTVITLAGAGSVAVLRDDSESTVIFTWPQWPSQYCDPTGSGDAFGAGVVWSWLNMGPFKSSDDYTDAFTVGSLWGSAACEEYGGQPGSFHATDTWSRLRQLQKNEHPSIRRKIDQARGLLHMLDSGLGNANSFSSATFPP